MNLKIATAIALIAVPSSLWAATYPYSNDFSTTGLATADSTYSLSSGVYKFSTSNSTVVASNATVPVTGVPNTGSFTVQTQFTVTSFGTPNSNNEQVGLGALGLDNAFTGSTTTNAYYLADWTVGTSGTAGTLRIAAPGKASGFSAVNATVDNNFTSGGLAAVAGTTYTLKLAGTYVGSTLNLTLGVYDAAGTTQIGTSATATDTSPLTGTNFGYRNRIGIGSGTFTTNFDNFSVTPEPASLALLGLAGMLTLRRRSR